MPTTADRRPVLFTGGTVLTMDDQHTVLTDADVLVVDDRIAEVGTGLSAPDGAEVVDASGRHRDAGDDRHPPPHVADGDARLRRRLDPHAVLRLVLPRARREVPPRGRARGQPALGVGRPRGRGHHHRRLVARPADRRPRRGGGRRAARGARPVRPRLRQHPGRPVGVDRGPGRPPASSSGTAAPTATCSASSSPSTSPATRPSRRRRPSSSPATSASPSPPTPACGVRPTTTASA